MKLVLKKGSVNVPTYIFIQDSSSTAGAGLAGLVFNSAGLVASYVRPLAARVALTLVTQTVTGAHSDGGFVEVDATNMAGFYRLDLSDAVCASGVDSVTVMLKGATNMAPLLLEIQLTDVDLNDGVRAGMMALPNAAADAAGGLPISDGGGLNMDGVLSGNVPQTGDSFGLADGGSGFVAIKGVVDGIPTTAMRGTDDAALAADLVLHDDNLATVAAAVAAIPTTAMRGTDGAATAASLATAQTDLDTLTDASGEPGQGAPPVSAPDSVKLAHLYKAWRNRSNQTATTNQLFNDDAVTVDQKVTVSDDGTTAEKGEVATGP